MSDEQSVNESNEPLEVAESDIAEDATEATEDDGEATEDDAATAEDAGDDE